MINNYLKIPAKLLYWERLKPGRKNYALVIVAIKNMRMYMDQKINAQNITYALQNSLPIVTIYALLNKMIKENILYKDDNGFDISSNFIKNIDNLKIKSKTEYFVVYYYMIRYAIENKHSVYIAYLASRLANYYEKKKWPKVMHTKYVHTLMECLFTPSEEHTMMRHLVKDKILLDRSYREKKGSWITIPVYEYNEKRVTELVIVHERAIKNTIIKKLYLEEEQHNEQEEQTPAIVIEDVDKLREHTTYVTRDRVKSGSYTKEEIAAFRAMAESGEIETF